MIEIARLTVTLSLRHSCPAKRSKSELSHGAASSDSRADAAAHWQRCESEGLQCPQEVFAQLFHEQSDNEEFAVIVRSIDWGRVRWELQEISGMALRHVRVAREYQHALDEARDQATRFGIVDERREVVDHWRDASRGSSHRSRLPAIYSAAGQGSSY